VELSRVSISLSSERRHSVVELFSPQRCLLQHQSRRTIWSLPPCAYAFVRLFLCIMGMTRYRSYKARVGQRGIVFPIVRERHHTILVAKSLLGYSHSVHLSPLRRSIKARRQFLLTSWCLLMFLLSCYSFLASFHLSSRDRFVLLLSLLYFSRQALNGAF
jgi:hypothetical protein